MREPNFLYRQSLLNTIKAAAADIDQTSMTGYTVLPGLSPMKTTLLVDVIEKAYAAEVRQFVTVTIPTVAASTMYNVFGSELQADDNNKNRNKYKNFAYTSDPVLSGTVLTDQVKVAYVLGWKIRRFAAAGSINVVAGPVATLTNATTAYAGAVGDVIVGTLSGARAVVAVVTSATVKVVIMTGESNTDFTDTEPISINGVVTTTTAATNVYTGNLGILDDAGYYPAMGHRKGASSWNRGTNIVTVTVTTAAVMGFGIGTRLLQDIPVLEQHSPNLNSGIWDFNVGTLPSTAGAYSRFIIIHKNETDPDSMTTSLGNRLLSQAIWLDTLAANYAALRTALLALA